MEHQEWDDLGAKIQDIINSAVNEQDYRKLSRNINQTVNKAIDSGSEALKGVLNGAFGGSQTQDYRTNENPEHNARAYETHKDHGYQQPPFGRSQGIPPRMHKQSGYGLSMPGLYRKTGGERAKGILMTIFGGVFYCRLWCCFSCSRNCGSSRGSSYDEHCSDPWCLYRSWCSAS